MTARARARLRSGTFALRVEFNTAMEMSSNEAIKQAVEVLLGQAVAAARAELNLRMGRLGDSGCRAFP